MRVSKMSQVMPTVELLCFAQQISIDPTEQDACRHRNSGPPQSPTHLRRMSFDEATSSSTSVV
jgi:hypothetical protein